LRSAARLEINIAFLRDSFKKGSQKVHSMTHPESVVSTLAPKSVAGLAILLLVLSAVFGFLNGQKIKALRTNLASAQTGRDAAERRVRDKLNAPAGGTIAVEQGRVAEAESRAAKAEAALAQLQKEKTDLQAKLDDTQKETASLQKRAEEAGKNSDISGTGDPAGSMQTTDLQSQLDDLRRQLDSAEKEKTFLSEKLQDAQEHASQPKEGKKRRETVRETRPRRTGLQGTVLAANQAYNFVVLNLGARQGVESNAEMLVLRDGTLIGKIRISSVEPATAIGDIITSSLARGVQVQPGDNVIYAGTNP
jgi:multidrug efflux pump subunit AcrA (membrane-fusion protein)